jgi:hypothetical protein
VVTLPQVVAAVQGNPLGHFAIASTAQTPLPFVPSGDVTDPSSVASQTLVGSLFGALTFHARGAGNVVDLTHGHTPFDNHATQYALGTPVLPAPAVSSLIAAANAGVARFTFDPSAENYLVHHFTPSGDLRIPVLTVHNTWDPIVPAFHEAAAGAGAGRGGDGPAAAALRAELRALQHSRGCRRAVVRGPGRVGGDGSEAYGRSTGSPLGTLAGAIALRSRAAGSVSAFMNSVTSSIVCSANTTPLSSVSRVARMSSKL